MLNRDVIAYQSHGGSAATGAMKHLLAIGSEVIGDRRYPWSKRDIQSAVLLSFVVGAMASRAPAFAILLALIAVWLGTLTAGMSSGLRAIQSAPHGDRAAFVAWTHGASGVLRILLVSTLSGIVYVLLRSRMTSPDVEMVSLRNATPMMLVVTLIVFLAASAIEQCVWTLRPMAPPATSTPWLQGLPSVFLALAFAAVADYTRVTSYALIAGAFVVGAHVLLWLVLRDRFSISDRGETSK